MPYLNIPFHNTRHGGASINQNNSRQNYTFTFPNNCNVFQTNAGPGATAAAVGGAFGAAGAWGNCVSGTVAEPHNACGIFLCESPPYASPDYARWNGAAPAVPNGIPTAVPVFPNDHVQSGYTPFVVLNTLCAYLEGRPDNLAVGVPTVGPTAPIVASPDWVGAAGQALRCLGTGAAPLLNGNAPWGSDRYGLVFQALRRTYPNNDRIFGVFVHTKNTDGDPGTQIAALCRRFQNAIVFGDLNLNLRQQFSQQSLAEAVGGTHTLLAIQVNAGGPYYYTRYDAFGAGTACLDYALVPNAHAADVELWAHRPGAAASLTVNNSDHSMMMLRIRCT